MTRPLALIEKMGMGYDEDGSMLDGPVEAVLGTVGPDQTPRDFVEYPSQVNELWALDPTPLSRYAIHHQTGEPMPTQWADTLRASTLFGQGFSTTENVAAALLDQVWHCTPLDELPTDADQVQAFESQALARVGLDYDLVPPRYRSAFFWHAFGAWGYDACYYAYLWSEALAADTATFFTETGVHVLPASARRLLPRHPTAIRPRRHRRTHRAHRLRPDLPILRTTVDLRRMRAMVAAAKARRRRG